MIHVSWRMLDCLNLLCHGLLTPLRSSRKVSFDGLTCSSFMFSDRYLEFLILLEESATLSDFHLVDSLVCSFFRDSVPYI